MLSALLPGSVVGSVLAHGGEPVVPAELWRSWNLDPVVLVSLVLAAWAFARGAARRRHPLEPWRTWSFAGALVAIGIALVSPLEPLSGSLASAHMVQHVLLVLVAAPLLAVAAPSTTLLRGSPLVVRQVSSRWRRRLRLTRDDLAVTRWPAALWLAHVVTLWFWHASVPYDAALGSWAVHVLEHATFLATGWWFWRVVVGRRVDRVPGGTGLLLVFAMALQSVFLAALLTFAREPWYDGYAATTEPWGLTHLADQQLAGAIMWVPAGLVYLAAGLVLLVTWIGAPDVDADPHHVPA